MLYCEAYLKSISDWSNCVEFQSCLLFKKKKLSKYYKNRLKKPLINCIHNKPACYICLLTIFIVPNTTYILFMFDHFYLN